MPAKRKIRSHGQLPAGYSWREGRPRWVAAPGLRKAGWKGGLDLKDPRGQWLGEGPSIDAARAIADAVALWRSGQPVPLAQAAIAPAGARIEGSAAPLRPDQLDPFSLGALEKEFLEHIAGERAAGTLKDYRGKMARLVDAFGGFAKLPARGDQAGHALRALKAAETRAQLIFGLEPYEDPRLGLVDLWTTAYKQLKKHSGDNQAYGVMATAGSFLSWVHRYRTRKVLNWANVVERTTPDGRIVTLTWDEIEALVRAADTLGLHSVGDAVVFAFDLGWSQVDVLAMTFEQIAGGRVAGARQKTGRKGTTPLTYLGKARLAQVQARRRGDADAALLKGPVILCERTGKQWKADHFRHVFAEVRFWAGWSAPGLVGKTFADIRDTAFTWGTDAGLTNEGKASRSRHSLRNIDQLADRHYGEITADVADQAAAQMEALYRARGVKL